MSAVEVCEWPAVRDAVKRLDVSQPWVLRLIGRGELRAVRTRLGWLLDPDSLEAYARAREARRQSA